MLASLIVAYTVGTSVLRSAYRRGDALTVAQAPPADESAPPADPTGEEPA